MNIKEIEIDKLHEYENNPRINDNAVESVAESIKQFGFKVPIVIDKDKVIIAGHTRLKAAKRLNITSVPCIVADDLTPEQVKAFRIADNKTGELAEWDMEALEKELQELTAFDVDMSVFGFEEELLEERKEVEEDDVPEVDEENEPTTKLGDIWQLGRHRLICGDSTKEEDITMLMNGNKVDLYLTDPPYNIAVSNSQGKTIMNDDISNDDFKDLLQSAFKTADGVMKEGAAFYIWHAESESYNFRKSSMLAGWKIRQCLIWVKNHFTMGRQDYQWKHEPCLYGWKDGAGHYFVDDRTQSTVFEDKININKLTKVEMQEMLKELLEDKTNTTIIHIDKPTVDLEHPTMKPVKLIAKLIENSSKKNATVLDSFGGSGTTLIACEQLDRICYMVELDPRYCDVIIQRWENLTGKSAVKVAI